LPLLENPRNAYVTLDPRRVEGRVEERRVEARRVEE